MKSLVSALIALLACSASVWAQESAPAGKSQNSTSAEIKEVVNKRNLGFSGGWVHITGDQGLDGFNVSGELMVHRPVAVAFDYDGAWDNSRLGTFETTQVGLIAVKSHLQDWLIGPRFYLPGLVKHKTGKFHLLSPFAEAQFGESNLNSKVQAPSQAVNVTTSATSFAWMLGGGNDFRLNPHWGARVKVDLLRTHFASSGQSRLRFSLGLVYTVRRRSW
jgi:hypothetical protein